MTITGIRSAIRSIISGFVAVLITKENLKSTLLLGIFLLAFGILILSMVLNHVPFWDRILILLHLIPLTLLVGKLKKQMEGF